MYTCIPCDECVHSSNDVRILCHNIVCGGWMSPSGKAYTLCVSLSERNLSNTSEVCRLILDGKLHWGLIKDWVSLACWLAGEYLVKYFVRLTHCLIGDHFVIL